MASVSFVIQGLCWTMLALALLFWAYRMEELTEKILAFMLPFSLGVALMAGLGV